jgi:hypothetical protein
MRKGFTRTMRDPELTAEADRIKLDVLPVAGEELQRRIVALYATPAVLVEKARQAFVLKR